jgi:hypothetical protein
MISLHLSKELKTQTNMAQERNTVSYKDFNIDNVRYQDIVTSESQPRPAPTAENPLATTTVPYQQTPILYQYSENVCAPLLIVSHEFSITKVADKRFKKKHAGQGWEIVIPLRDWCPEEFQMKTVIDSLYESAKRELFRNKSKISGLSSIKEKDPEMACRMMEGYMAKRYSPNKRAGGQEIPGAYGKFIDLKNFNKRQLPVGEEPSTEKCAGFYRAGWDPTTESVVTVRVPLEDFIQGKFEASCRALIVVEHISMIGKYNVSMDVDTVIVESMKLSSRDSIASSFINKNVEEARRMDEICKSLTSASSAPAAAAGVESATVSMFDLVRNNSSIVGAPTITQVPEEIVKVDEAPAPALPMASLLKPQLTAQSSSLPTTGFKSAFGSLKVPA